MYEMRIYLLNNTKPYRDGDEEYAGEWFNCPVEFEEVREKLGVEHEEQIEIGEIPDRIRSYIDYEAYGRDLDLEGRFVVTNHGVFECPY